MAELTRLQKSPARPKRPNGLRRAETLANQVSTLCADLEANPSPTSPSSASLLQLHDVITTNWDDLACEPKVVSAVSQLALRDVGALIAHFRDSKDALTGLVRWLVRATNQHAQSCPVYTHNDGRNGQMQSLLVPYRMQVSASPSSTGCVLPVCSAAFGCVFRSGSTASG